MPLRDPTFAARAETGSSFSAEMTALSTRSRNSPASSAPRQEARSSTNDAAEIKGLDALWWAAGLSARWAFTPALALAGRGEVYRDEDGVITGRSQTLTSATLTVESRVVEALVLKLEGRWDHSTARVFQTRSGGFEDDELIVLGSAVATF